MSDDFDWENDPTVVVKEQPGLAVYENARGGITIRKSDGDYFALEREHVELVAGAMLALIGGEPVRKQSTPHAPKDRTAAERQRRYRQRKAKRNGRDTVTVTPNGRDIPSLSFGGGE